jgi:hypothetical protein
LQFTGELYRLLLKIGSTWIHFKYFSGMYTLFKKTGQFDSSIHYAHMLRHHQILTWKLKTYLKQWQILLKTYKVTGNKDSVIKYVELSQALKDSVLSDEKKHEVQAIACQGKSEQQQLIANRSGTRVKFNYLF